MEMWRSTCGTAAGPSPLLQTRACDALPQEGRLTAPGRLRGGRYVPTGVEQEQRRVNRRAHVGSGVGPVATAQPTLQGNAALPRRRKGQREGLATRDVLAQTRAIPQRLGGGGLKSVRPASPYPPSRSCTTTRPRSLCSTSTALGSHYWARWYTYVLHNDNKYPRQTAPDRCVLPQKARKYPPAVLQQSRCRNS